MPRRRMWQWISSVRRDTFPFAVLDHLLPESSLILAVTAVIRRLVGEKGLVVGIDHLEPLTSLSERNLKADNVDINTENRPSGVKIVTGDGRQGSPASGS